MRSINAHKPWVHFENKEAGMGNAKEEIWTNPEGFEAKVDEFVTATGNLNIAAQSATDIDGVKGAFGALSGSCKGCHEGFKVPRNN